MKKGESITIKIKLDVDFSFLEKIIFTIKKENSEKAAVALQKIYIAPFEQKNQNFHINLTSEDTNKIGVGEFYLEAMLEFCDKSIAKSKCAHFAISPSLQ